MEDLINEDVQEEDIVITEDEHLGESIIVNAIKVNMEIGALDQM